MRPTKRFRFSIRHLFVLTVAVAATVSLITSFGSHFLRASRHVVAQRYTSWAKIDNRLVQSDCELSTCEFNGLSFDVPVSMIGTARIVRASSVDVWLVFEDATGMLQIPLVPTDMRTAMALVPPELKNLSAPQLLEMSISAASDDFSFTMSKDELSIHGWAMETREALNLDAQNMDRYSRFSGEDIDGILMSADPASIDSGRRIRSIFVWESTDSKNFGAIWFGDSRNVEAGWIDSVVRSVALVPGDRLSSAELAKLNDAEILSRFKALDSQTK